MVRAVYFARRINSRFQIFCKLRLLPFTQRYCEILVFTLENSSSSHFHGWQDSKNRENRWQSSWSICCFILPEVAVVSWRTNFALFFLWAYRSKLRHTNQWIILGWQLYLSLKESLHIQLYRNASWFFMSNVSRSFDSSGKVLPRFFISQKNFCTLSEKDFSDRLVCS